MKKKLFFLIIFTLLFVPTITNAHTALTSSNPADGQVVTEDLIELVLTFAGEIESLSTMKLLENGEEVPLNVELQEKQMIGTFSTPIDNGSYVIEWSIAGEDGHVITGEIPFTVQLKQVDKEQTTETKEPITPDKEDRNTDNQTETDNTNEQNNKPATNSIQLIVSIIVVLILVIGLYMLFGRKK